MAMRNEHVDPQDQQLTAHLVDKIELRLARAAHEAGSAHANPILDQTYFQASAKRVQSFADGIQVLELTNKVNAIWDKNSEHQL